MKLARKLAIAAILLYGAAQAETVPIPASGQGTGGGLPAITDKGTPTEGDQPRVDRAAKKVTNDREKAMVPAGKLLTPMNNGLSVTGPARTQTEDGDAGPPASAKIVEIIDEQNSVAIGGAGKPPVEPASQVQVKLSQPPPDQSKAVTRRGGVSTDPNDGSLRSRTATSSQGGAVGVVPAQAVEPSSQEPGVGKSGQSSKISENNSPIPTDRKTSSASPDGNSRNFGRYADTDTVSQDVTGKVSVTNDASAAGPANGIDKLGAPTPVMVNPNMGIPTAIAIPVAAAPRTPNPVMQGPLMGPGGAMGSGAMSPGAMGHH